MLTEICQYLKNWFNRKPDGSTYPQYRGVLVISEGNIVCEGLADGQYFRIIGSLFNDGVHKYGDADLTDETFEGAVWSMGVPPTVIQLAQDITDWQAKYGAVDGAAMSPYQSESFDGYSYSKQSGGTSAGGSSSAVSWTNVFASRLRPWRKL